jgi:mono/diheme cytochrome c family protein
MKTSASWALTITAAVVVGCLLVTGFTVFFALRGGFPWPITSSEGLDGFGYESHTYTTNGQRIYYTGINQRGERIPFRGGPMWLAMHGGGCVNCHGDGGQGGIPVMMGTEIPSDIRYHILTEEEHDEHEGEGHPPYTDETIKRAITEGLNPAGDPLDYSMPRWQLSELDQEDLLEFLKTLE